MGLMAEYWVKGRVDPLAPITRTEFSAIGHAQLLGSGARIAERRLARIDAKPACSGPFGKRRQQQRAGSGAQVEDGARHPRSEMRDRCLDQRLAVGADRKSTRLNSRH